MKEPGEIEDPSLGLPGDAEDLPDDDAEQEHDSDVNNDDLEEDDD